MEFRILGPLEVLDDGHSMALGGEKQRALLALLVINANRTLSRERLIDELWGERPPATAAKTLQAHVSRLRKSLGRSSDNDADQVVVTRERGYELRVDRESVDSLRFERLIGEARRELAAGRSGRACCLLEEALALWRGPPLAELVSERFAGLEIARLEELRIGALEERTEAMLASGRHAEVVGEVESLISEQPYRERLRAQLMLALYRCDRQAEALQVYQDARRQLVEELGIEPGERLRELERAILAQDPALAFTENDSALVEVAVGDGSRVAFVGRERELSELIAGLDDACAGRGRLLLLVGEPGIGKSRLTEELIVRAEARGAQVLVGRCWEAGGAPAYWPWVQSLREYVRESETAALLSELAAGAGDLAQIIPELRALFPDLPDPPQVDPEQARFRLFDATAGFMRNASKRRPLVLVLDDLHAADAPSLLLLRFLVRELASMQVLIVGAYRDVDPIPGESMTEMLAEVAREPVTRRLALGGLSERDVEEYMQLTAAEIATSELATGLHAETEGNPLFLGEIVRLMAAEGASPPNSGGLVIPQSIRDVIARRLAHLSPKCHALLAAASVIGREFGLPALEAATGLEEDELLEALDEAIGARVISEAPGERTGLRFAHVLVRDTLYDDLGAARRVRLHRQVMRALEALYGEQPGPHLAELAHQATAAREFDQAVRYAWQAGDHSLTLLAYEEAARLYQAALDRLDSTADDERCELLLALGEAQSRAGDTEGAQATSLEAARVARRLGIGRALARAAACYGGRLAIARANRDSRIVPLLEEGLAALAEDEVELRARLLARLAGALRDEPSRERRDALSREAVELAVRSGDLATLTYALDGRAGAIIAHDTTADLIALGSELIAVAMRAGDLEKAVAGHMHRRSGELILGDIAGAENDLAAAEQLAEQLRQPVHQWWVTAPHALAALTAGRLAEAAQLMEKAIALGEHAQPHIAIPIYWFQRLTLADWAGGLGDVGPALRDLAARYPARVMFRCAVAYLDARLGRLADARRELEGFAAEGFSGLPIDQEWLYGMTLLAEVAAIVDHARSAEPLYRLLVPWAELNAADPDEGIRGSVSRYLGLLATTLGRNQQAATHYEQAITANTRMGAVPWIAHSQRDFAQLLLIRNQAGDRQRGLDLVSEAVSTYQQLGMDAWAAAGIELQRGLQTARHDRR